MSAEICRKSAREGVTQGAEGLPQGPRHAKALSRPESAAPCPLFPCPDSACALDARPFRHAAENPSRSLCHHRSPGRITTNLRGSIPTDRDPGRARTYTACFGCPKSSLLHVRQGHECASRSGRRSPHCSRCARGTNVRPAPAAEALTVPGAPRARTHAVRSSRSTPSGRLPPPPGRRQAAN